MRERMLKSSYDGVISAVDLLINGIKAQQYWQKFVDRKVDYDE